MYTFLTRQSDLPFQRRTHQEYLATAARCTILAIASHATAAEIQNALALDTRDEGAHGRALTRAVHGTTGQRNAPATLLHGDRLEIGGDVADTHQDLTTTPANPMRLVFFPRKEHCCITALNPLFDIITLDNVALDVLHTLDLGVAQYFAGAVFAFVIKSDL